MNYKSYRPISLQIGLYRVYGNIWICANERGRITLLSVSLCFSLFIATAIRLYLSISILYSLNISINMYPRKIYFLRLKKKKKRKKCFVHSGADPD